MVYRCSVLVPVALPNSAAARYFDVLEAGSQNWDDGQGLWPGWWTVDPLPKSDAVGDDVDRMAGSTESVLRSFSAAGWRDITITLPD